MPIKLTPLGEKVIKTLTETTAAPLTTRLSPDREFALIRREEGWSLANDALLVMSGDGFNPESENPIIVGQALADAMGIPPALADELIQALYQQGAIGILPLGLDQQFDWLESVLSEVFSHESRLRMILKLSIPHGNVELCEEMGLALMTMRHHLNVMQGQHFVEVAREGIRKYYSVCRPMLVVFLRRFQRIFLEEEHEREVSAGTIPASEW